jgi:hypothetical protein
MDHGALEGLADDDHPSYPVVIYGPDEPPPPAGDRPTIWFDTDEPTALPALSMQSGTWLLHIGTGSGWWTSENSYGHFRRIGDLCHFWLSFVAAATIPGDGVRFDLPFPQAPVPAWQACSVGYAGGVVGFTAADGAYPIMAYIDATGMYGLRVAYQNNGGVTVQLTGANIGAGTHFIISGTYVIHPDYVPGAVVAADGRTEPPPIVPAPPPAPPAKADLPKTPPKTVKPRPQPKSPKPRPGAV